MFNLGKVGCKMVFTPVAVPLRLVYIYYILYKNVVGFAAFLIQLH